ncbi:MAG: glycosyltransferase [Armatimonadota bacterium]
MKKLLVVTTGLAYGGAETQLTRLALRLKQRSWVVSVASMLPPAAYVDELEAAGIRVYNLRMRRKVPDPRAIWRLAVLVRRMRPTIVHSFMVHANLLARICRLFSPMPVLICSARNINEGGRWREWAYRLTDPLCDLTTQVCKAGMEGYIQRRVVPSHKITYVPNGIDTARFAPNPTIRGTLREQLGVGDRFVWLTVGRLEPQKDYPNLLQAFHQVVKTYPTSAYLLIVGKGPLQNSIEATIERMELGQQMRLLGIRTDIPELLNAADAFVMASAWEGMSNALLEASACALPIVATDVGGNSEIVLHGKTGLLVPPRQPQALAEAMQQIMNLSPTERQAMGQAGRAHVVANFELERIVDRWEQLYIQLLNQKGISISAQNLSG